MSRITVTDEAIAEIVARSGGYEEVERAGKWVKLANALGLRKELGPSLRNRYEDMLRASAEADHREDEDEEEEYEVEDILDARVDDKGAVEYLVKWKDAIGEEGADADTNVTWEPREHLACPELLQLFEEKQRQRKAADAAGAPAPAPHDAADGDEQPAADGIGADAAVEGAADGVRGVDADADAQAHKRTADDAEFDGPPPSGGEGAAYRRVLRMRRAAPTAEDGNDGSKLDSKQSFVFEVERTDGSTVLVSNEQLRAEAPLLQLDFYEAHISFAPTQ
jgi:hypothetical protein